MGLNAPQLNEDYWYTEDQINPSVKIHAVSRKRSLFSTTDYLLIAIAISASVLAYMVRLLF